jgi:hypothetical protein
MSPGIEVGGPRVLLVEAVDAIGADAADARDRVALLRSAGASVVPLAVVESRPPSVTHGDSFVVEAGPDARAALQALLHRDRFDCIVLASATPGGGALAERLPAGTAAFWWPTGLGKDPRDRGLAGLLGRLAGRRRLASLWTGVDAAAPELEVLAGLGVEEGGARRVALLLWDGDVVVAPEGFRGAAGRLVLDAFASLAGEWSGVDVVAWTEAPVEGERYARRLGIEGRIHHAGAPTRMAEWAWWKHSQAVIFTGTRAISRGLLLRALASGCPVLCVGGGRGLATAVAPLSRLGCVRVVDPEPRAVAAALAQLLARDPQVEHQVERGRAISSTHTREALRDALAGWLGTRPASGVRAA